VSFPFDLHCAAGFDSQTRPHNVNQMGKTQSKAVEKGMVGERQGNGMGTVWEQHGNGMVCVNPPLDCLAPGTGLYIYTIYQACQTEGPPRAIWVTFVLS
jgi:hypothetical protein